MTRRLRAWLIERFTLGILGAVAAMAFFVFVAHAVAAGSTRRFDAEIASVFAGHQTATSQRVMQGISLFASSGVLLTVAAACLLSLRRFPAFRPDALSMLIALSGGECLVICLKALFHRPRPAEVFAHLGYSFPSGHSFFALTLYGMIGYWLTRNSAPHRPWIWPVAITLIVLVGISRIALGVHYASDVVAGFAVGLPWLWACLALPQAFHRTPGQDQRS